MFYVKMPDDLTKEMVLKVYKKEDIKSFNKETKVFKDLQLFKDSKLESCLKRNSKGQAISEGEE